MIKKQNIFWGALFILMDAIAVILEIITKEAQSAGPIFFNGYVIACVVFGIIGVAYTVSGAIGLARGSEQNHTKKSDTRSMCAVAVFCAVAYVLTYVKIPVEFLSMEIKDSIIVLCALIFGPMAGLKIAILVPFFEMISHSSTGVYGLIMNILSSATFAVVAGLIYKYKRSFYGALAALLSGVFFTTAVMLLANLFVTPFYMGVPFEVVVDKIPALFLPFNLIKATLNGAVVLLLYKPLSRILKKIRFGQGSGFDAPRGEANVGRTVAVSCIAAAVILVSLAIVFFILR